MPLTLQPYVDNVGNSRVEEAVVSFYATKGLWEADRRLGSVVTNTLDFYEEDIFYNMVADSRSFSCL